MSQLALIQTYRDVQEILSEQVRRASLIDGQKRHQRADLAAEAAIGFMQAWLTYNSEKGSFRRRVSFLVWYQLLRFLQSQDRKTGNQFPESNARESNHDERQSLLDHVPSRPADPSSFSFGTFLGDLGEDARVLARLVVETPDDFAQYLWHAPRRKRPRTCLRDYVEETYDWTQERFCEAFAEVQDVLWIWS